MLVCLHQPARLPIRLESEVAPTSPAFRDEKKNVAGPVSSSPPPPGKKQKQFTDAALL